MLNVHVTSLKILSVTMMNGLSAADHVRDVIGLCAQTLYALRVLLAHGMCDERCRPSTDRSSWPSYCIQCVVLLHQGGRQATSRRISRPQRYCPPDLPSFEELLKTSDQQLFNKIQLNQWHLLIVEGVVDMSCLSMYLSSWLYFFVYQ